MANNTRTIRQHYSPKLNPASVPCFFGLLLPSGGGVLERLALNVESVLTPFPKSVQIDLIRHSTLNTDDLFHDLIIPI